MGTIYALVDEAEPHDYRYVGQTVQPLADRLRKHRRSRGKDHVSRWIRKVQARGGTVGMRVIAQVPTDRLSFAECQYIAALREAGYRLTNIAPGGSVGGFPPGYYKHSPETLKKMRQNRSYVKRTSAPRRRKDAAVRGSELWRSRISASVQQAYDEGRIPLTEKRREASRANANALTLEQRAAGGRAPWTEERRAQHRQTMKAAWAKRKAGLDQSKKLGEEGVQDSQD